MRLFMAVQLSGEMKRTLTGAMHDLKQAGVKGNYVPAGNLHLTLAFIGETDHPGDVKDALKGLKYKDFRLSLTEMGTFGDVLWAGVKGNQGLSGAAKAVRDALDAAGIEYDKNKFTPHITLVRKATGPWKKVKLPEGEMTVKSISLMKTTFKDGKPVYSEVCAL